MDNRKRAQFAKNAVAKMAEETGLDLKTDGLETAVTDLLANMMHLCDRDGIDFGHQLRMAEMHYDAEKTNQYA